MGRLEEIKPGEWFWRESVVYCGLSEPSIPSSEVSIKEEKQGSDIGLEKQKIKSKKIAKAT